MKIIFLDFDGVITTYETKWKIDCNKLALVKKIIQEIDAKIVVTSSWKHGSANVEEFKDKLAKRNKDLSFNEMFQWFVSNIYDTTDSKGSWRGDEIQRWLKSHEVESYVILDDDSDVLTEQLFNFVQTDSFEGITEREVKLCIMVLNKKRIPNPIRMNLVLTTMWRNNCSGLEENNIQRMLNTYYNNFYEIHGEQDKNCE